MNNPKQMNLLEKIKHYFDHHIALAASDGNTEEKLNVASAALLMEMLHMEASCENQKQDMILGLLTNTFGLPKDQASELMAIAEHKRRQATDYFEFTHYIGMEYTREQKLQLLESLWKIAFVDNNLAVDEEYLIDKVARLLFIPHVEVLQVRNRVRGL